MGRETIIDSATGEILDAPDGGSTSLILRDAPGIKLSQTGMQIDDDLTFAEYEQLGRDLNVIEGAVQWWRGDWLNYGERRWGEMYAQAIQDEWEVGYQALANYAWVAKQVEFSIRIENLSWTHHYQVAPLPPDEQREWLARAVENEWSVAQLKREIRNERLQAATLAEVLQTNRFAVIAADPPWQYSNSGFSTSAEAHYPTMPTEDIAAMPVADYTTTNAVLFLWATNPLLPDALQVMAAWGFEYKTNMVWVKNSHVAGFYVYGQHELLLIGVKGSAIPDYVAPSVIQAPADQHSAKPDEAYSIIEKMYPHGPYLELFARKERPGWAVFGNEVERGGNVHAVL
jgi:N6-adenosine-specific RNA methylase IME4